MCDFQQCAILKCLESEEPVQPPYQLRNSKCCLDSSFYSQRLFKQLAKALIRLRICAGWSEPLLVAHTTLLEISCRGSFMVSLVRLSFMGINVSLKGRR